MYIDNEIPTDGELAVYFLENFNSSVLLTFSSESTLRWSEEVEKVTSLLQRTEYEKFTKLCLSSIFFVLSGINNVSRDNDLWNNTNNRPTLGRIGEYFNSKELNETELEDLLEFDLLGELNPFRITEYYEYYGEEKIEINGNVVFDLYFLSTLSSKLVNDEVKVGLKLNDIEKTYNKTVEITSNLLNGKIQKNEVIIDNKKAFFLSTFYKE